jgi:hypothetical protein
MFLTGAPPGATDNVGAGAEMAALAAEIEEIINEARSKSSQQAAIAG